MTLDQSGADPGGVAPAVAIALIVGLTLLSAAVTGGFLWTITPDDDRMSGPNAKFDMEQHNTTVTVDGERVNVTALTFRHAGGDTIDAAELEVRQGTTSVPATPGLGPDGDLATFEGETVTKGDEVTVVAAADFDEEGGTVAVETVDGQRRLTDGNGTVVELEPGDEVALVWTSGDAASTIAVETVE